MVRIFARKFSSDGSGLSDSIGKWSIDVRVSDTAGKIPFPGPISWKGSRQRPTLVKSVGREGFAARGYVREGKSERSVRMTLSLAFLSPVLAEAATDGRLPRGFSVKRLTELPMLWSDQWGALGLREPIQAQAELA